MEKDFRQSRAVSAHCDSARCDSARCDSARCDSARCDRGAARPGSVLVVIATLALLWTPSATRADDTPPDADETHPIYAASSHWVESLLIAAGGLFLAAAVIGPIVRAEAPDAVPAAMSHEEDPAADRH